MVASFSLAVNRQGSGNNTDFFNVTAWKSTAEFITKYFHKGSSICIVGQINNREWTDQSGQKRFATEIVADDAYFVDSRGEIQPTAQPVANAQPVQQDYMAAQYQQLGQQTQAAMQPTAPAFSQIDEDEALPF
jgi:single-strand DNA-binding protein